ncbi:hypothetical protein D584_25489 [Brucella intermedia M86]|uniref:Uncharacterized protein n=1 Tax=Brucella intermedia M86 TaxID=1234597 RepID=M5JJG8_9HYPH|nr:hypothetical protein D584_25489 [Brucella intermedia M86]
MNDRREKGDVRLTTRGEKGEVHVQLETDDGTLRFGVSAQGATDFGVQLIKAAKDAERCNG